VDRQAPALGFHAANGNFGMEALALQRSIPCGFRRLLDVTASQRRDGERCVQPGQMGIFPEPASERGRNRRDGRDGISLTA
jgi:hypothetical protein